MLCYNLFLIMVSRSEYLKALEIIDKYHAQNLSNNKWQRKTTIAQFLNSVDCPNYIQAILTGHGGRHQVYFEFIEDITLQNWIRHNRASKTNFEIFNELRNQFFNCL